MDNVNNPDFSETDRTMGPLAWKVRCLEPGNNEILVFAELGVKCFFLDWRALKKFSPGQTVSKKDLHMLLSQTCTTIDSFHTIHGEGLDIGETDNAQRQKALLLHHYALELACECGARTVVFHTAEKYSIAAREAACRSLDELLPHAERSQVVIALENMKMPYFGSRPDELTFFLSKYKSPFFGICFDVGHANIMEGVLPVLHRLIPHIETVHVHDNDGTQDAHLPLGMGTIDWSLVHKRLREKGYMGKYVCEARPPQGMTREEALHISLKVLS